MNFTISEATGLFTTPLMLTMGENAYNLMNELGLLFIPFTIAIIQCFFDSRSQGADEGASAIVFIKALEARFIPMLAILICAVMPATSQTPNFEFNAYQCADAPSIISGADNVASLKPNTNFSGLYGNSNPPLLFGLINQIGSAMNGVGIGALNCSAGANRNEAAEIITNLELHKPIAIKALREFDQQCYTNALQTLNRLQANNEDINVNFNHAPYNTLDAFAYDADAIIKVYDGSITSPSRSVMYFDTPDYWSDLDSHTDDAITCASAASTITDTILDSLQSTSGRTRTKTWTGLVSKVQKTINTTNGNNYTESEAKTEMIRAAYRNNASNWYNPLLKRTSVEKTPTVETRATANNKSGRGMVAHDNNRVQQQENNSGSAVSGLAFFGAMWSNLSKSIENMTYIRITPVLVTITQGAILAFGGIILLLSGYNSRALLHLLILYFALSLVPFFMNVGMIFDTVITGLVENKSNGLNITNTTVIEIVNYAATSVVYLCPLAWMTFMQLLGVHAGHALDMAGVAQAAKQASNKLVSKIGSSVGDGYKYGSKRLSQINGGKGGAGGGSGGLEQSTIMRLRAFEEHGANQMKKVLRDISNGR